MNRPTRRLGRMLLALCLALSMLSLTAGVSAAAEKFQDESLQAYEQQLAAGQIASATFNKRVRTMHLFLKDGKRVLVKYAAHGEPALAAQLQAKHVTVTIESKAQATKELKKPVHHKIRYIAGGIVIAVIVVVGAVLLVNRRRQRD